MLDALNSAVSGIHYGTQLLDVAAHNVANQATEGFERQELVAVETAQGGVEGRLVPGADTGPAKDLVSALIARHTVSLNAAVVRRADDVQGELVDLLA